MQTAISALICFCLFTPVFIHAIEMRFFVIPKLQRQLDDLKRRLEEMEKKQ